MAKPNSHTRTCTNCAETKPLTEDYFPKNGKYLRSVCKVCWNASKRGKAIPKAERVPVIEKPKAVKRVKGVDPLGKWPEFAYASAQSALDAVYAVIARVKARGF